LKKNGKMNNEKLEDFFNNEIIKKRLEQKYEKKSLDEKYLEDFFNNEIIKKKLKLEYEKNRWTEQHIIISIQEVLSQFTPEQLIDAIGEKKVEQILRNRKLKKIKK
jgi:hypothetical protein